MKIIINDQYYSNEENDKDSGQYQLDANGNLNLFFQVDEDNKISTFEPEKDYDLNEVKSHYADALKERQEDINEVENNIDEVNEIIDDNDEKIQDDNIQVNVESTDEDKYEDYSDSYKDNYEKYLKQLSNNEDDIKEESRIEEVVEDKKENNIESNIESNDKLYELNSLEKKGKIEVISKLNSIDGIEIRGARVNLYLLNGVAPKLYESKLTDSNGKIIFDNLPNGCYRVISIVDRRFFEKASYYKWNEVTIDKNNKHSSICIVNRIKQNYYKK